RHGGGVQLAWTTGYESDNLGFHVYREIDGRRTRITHAPIAGSGLLVGARTATSNGQRYSFWDRDPLAASNQALYWLQDVDFNGKVTWHGPIAPVAATGVTTEPPDSDTLDQLGAGVGYRHERVITRRADDDPRASALHAAVASPRDVQWTLAARAAIKIGVRAPGWYRVTQPALLAAGLDPQVDPRTLRLYV